MVLKFWINVIGVDAANCHVFVEPGFVRVLTTVDVEISATLVRASANFPVGSCGGRHFGIRILWEKPEPKDSNLASPEILPGSIRDVLLHLLNWSRFPMGSTPSKFS